MQDTFKIGCLGLVNKTDTVSQIINEKRIDICCLQEVDIPRDYNHELVAFKVYNLLIAWQICL